MYVVLKLEFLPFPYSESVNQLKIIQTKENILLLITMYFHKHKNIIQTIHNVTAVHLRDYRQKL